MTSQQQQMRWAEELVAAARRKNALQSNPQHLVDTEPIGTNFGNKLNRNAPYIKAGMLDAPRGADTYTQEINYHGYRRRIISRNPLLFDEYGDLIEEDSSDEEGDKPEGAPLEDNPYENINLQELLRPLASAADLPNHPTLSRPYNDKGLLEMIKNAEDTLHKEQKKLRALNEHFIRIRGDLSFAPIGDLHTQFDDWLLRTVFDGTPLAEEHNGTTAEPTEPLNWNGTSQEDPEGERGIHETTEVPEVEAQDVEMSETGPSPNNQEPPAQTDEAPLQNGDVPQADTEMADNQPAPTTNGTGPPATIPDNMIVNVPPSPPEPALPDIHPFFAHPPPQLPPAVSNEDDPLGHLLSYMSKQTEIVRLWHSLLEGLLKAQRLRSSVLRWCKAEAHVGEMSDNEDWVDLEEWGLHPDELKKGRDEDGDEVVEGGPNRRGGRGRGRGGANIGS
ncbi:hypothetical protein BT63DRAFT_480644 [Microthyrium microscopicum]|uniref:Transcriptional regulatory protein RXT2 N-terminal domain-containing protein n=1 Tax=Microthyrium microscopicum TaxID=703497 RepID=A0A6A6U8F3_9PEZI|nr:hypothetical protein BT63DRAFT_480644 [Microthyrium microscopicum]